MMRTNLSIAQQDISSWAVCNAETGVLVGWITESADKSRPYELAFRSKKDGRMTVYAFASLDEAQTEILTTTEAKL